MSPSELHLNLIRLYMFNSFNIVIRLEILTLTLWLVCVFKKIRTVLLRKTFKHMFIIHKGKDKAIPLQTWTGPEGSRRLRSPNFKKIGT